VVGEKGRDLGGIGDPPGLGRHGDNRHKDSSRKQWQKKE